jgi:hypothetical protein
MPAPPLRRRARPDAMLQLDGDVPQLERERVVHDARHERERCDQRQ